MTCRGRASILGPRPPGTQASHCQKRNRFSGSAYAFRPKSALADGMNTELRTAALRLKELEHVLRSGTGGSVPEKLRLFKPLRTQLLEL
jgi:hypothetical protein